MVRSLYLESGQKTIHSTPNTRAPFTGAFSSYHTSSVLAKLAPSWTSWLLMRILLRTTPCPRHPHGGDIRAAIMRAGERATGSGHWIGAGGSGLAAVAGLLREAECRPLKRCFW